VSEFLHFTLIDELPASCTIIDECGERMELKVQNERVNVKHLAPGKYVIQLFLDGKTQTETFVKIN
jgi:hypothetical protein